MGVRGAPLQVKRVGVEGKNFGIIIFSYIDVSYEAPNSVACVWPEMIYPNLTGKHVEILDFAWPIGRCADKGHGVSFVIFQSKLPKKMKICNITLYAEMNVNQSLPHQNSSQGPPGHSFS